jgi:hypothetical protein
MNADDFMEVVIKRLEDGYVIWSHQVLNKKSS